MSNPNVIEVTDLSFSYDKRSVLENIHLSVKAGSFLGLVGPNGSGKSTLIKCILGLIKPNEGVVKLFGTPIENFKQWDDIGFVSQKANSFNRGFPATVFEVVSMGLYGKIGLFRFLTKKHKEKVKEVIHRVGMEKYMHQNIGELSGGQQQRVFIARALVSEPKLLILDEPTVGVDEKSVTNFYEMLKEINREHGITLLLVTHDIGVMSKYVTEVVCLNKYIHFHGDGKQFTKRQDEIMAKLYGHQVQVITHNHAHGGGES